MAIQLALFIVVITIFILYLKFKHTYWQRRNIPHEKPNFPYGNVKGWRSTKHGCELLEPVYRKFKGTGPFVGMYFFFEPAVLAVDLQFIKTVLVTDFNYFPNRGLFFNEIDDPLTGNLFHMDGPKWKQLRQKITPTFTSSKMKLMFPMLLNNVHELIAVMKEKVTNTSEPLEITNLMSRFTADVIGNCAFGLNCNSLRNPNAEFVEIGKRALTERRYDVWINRLMESYPKYARKLRLCKYSQEIINFYMGIVRETEGYRQSNKVKRQDFINILFDMKSDNEGNESLQLNFNDIVAQAFVFFVAGFETSSTTLGFALYELAKQPHIQEKLRAEINEIFAKYNNEITYEAVEDLKYCYQVISETLRRYPVVPILTRRASKYYEYNGQRKYHIPEGTLVNIPSYEIHHDAEYYPDPYRFDPDRFTPEEIQKRPASTWLPFGDGPRNCIGLRFGRMQTIVGLAYLIRNFTFAVHPEQTPKTIEFLKANPLLNVVDGIKLEVNLCKNLP